MLHLNPAHQCVTNQCMDSSIYTNCILYVNYHCTFDVSQNHLEIINFGLFCHFISTSASWIFLCSFANLSLRVFHLFCTRSPIIRLLQLQHIPVLTRCLHIFYILPAFSFFSIGLIIRALVVIKAWIVLNIVDEHFIEFLIG